MIFPFVVYGCETWSLSLWLRVFEIEVLRKIFGPRREEVTGGWRKLRNGDLMAVLLPTCKDWQSKEVEIGGARGTYGKKKFVQRFGTES
jgi:hypothetical protein